MAVISMTGFARATGQYNNAENLETSWSIELRSVNGKGLDMRLRMPTSLETLEQDIKKLVASKLSRGNISLNINLKNQITKGAIELNKTAFNDLLNAAKTASEISGLPMPTLDALLNMRNVLQEQEAAENEEEVKALHQQILASIQQALTAIMSAREEEGAKLKVVIEERIVKIDRLTDEAITIAKSQTDDIKTKMKASIAHIIEQTDELDEQRLHQEAMYLAVKADITEELDRIKAHVEQAKDLLQRQEPIGRRLDFLCQEFNREANTLCSKSHSKELTYTGLELKTVIDQLREQVQNIE